MKPQKIKLGDTNLETYPFVLGGNVFGWTADENTSFKILDEYFAKGFTSIDTANMYSIWVKGHKGGESEAIIGKWMKNRKNRDKIILATKVGGKIDSKHKGLRREYIISCIDESLRNLQTDYIDLYYTHYDDKSIPIEDVLETYYLLIEQGKIRYIGTSNMSPQRIEDSMQVSKKYNLPQYSVLQPLYNLYDREIYEKQYKPIVEKYNLFVFTYYSLASGFLTGKYKSKSEIIGRSRASNLEKYFDNKGLKLLHTLNEMAKSKSVTQAQLALAWLIHQPSVTAPIASVSKPEQLEEILKSIEIDLSSEELKVLSQGE